MEDAHLLDLTGWSPSELDEVSEDRLGMLLIYKNVKGIYQNGGELY